VTRDPGQPRPGGSAPGGDAPAAEPGVRSTPRAQHGYVNEVRWREGQGRQPYANQGPEESSPPAATQEVEGGDRGAHSGVTQDQMAQARRKP